MPQKLTKSPNRAGTESNVVVMALNVDTEEALRNAVRALMDGPGDPRSVDGAKVNALQSIAWSLIGVLAKDTEMGEGEEEAMSDLVDRASLLAQVRP